MSGQKSSLNRITESNSFNYLPMFVKQSCVCYRVSDWVNIFSELHAQHEEKLFSERSGQIWKKRPHVGQSSHKLFPLPFL